MSFIVIRTHLFPTLGLCTTDDEVYERLVQVAEVGDLGGPVVHLDVDVGVDVRVPGRVGG